MFGKKSSEQHNKDMVFHVETLVETMKHPSAINVNFKFILPSVEIARLIQAGKTHRDKFDKPMVLKGLSEEQKKVFRILKLDSIIEI